VWKTVTAGDLDAKQFSVRQVFFTSKDGTRVPMFVITRAGAKLDGNAPTLLYGYGGFNIPLMPGFAASRLLWVQRFNGVYAMANLRGGGEYGEEWHKAGSLLQKQNVFDDFQAAAEYLIAEKYTCSQKLSIMGGSNGGLLVAACINQRPELYGAAVGQVGVMDMLKFHRYTIGYAWKSDYGDPDSPEYFDYLYGYSPLHNVNANKTYPATLLCTADHDDRVVPNHSYKLIAQLQHSLGEQPHQKAPLLIKIETKAGHGAGKPLSKQIDETASIFSFLAKTLGAQWQ
jgi:prolyl oligopeptidase